MLKLRLPKRVTSIVRSQIEDNDHYDCYAAQRARERVRLPGEFQVWQQLLESKRQADYDRRKRHSKISTTPLQVPGQIEPVGPNHQSGNCRSVIIW